MSSSKPVIYGTYPQKLVVPPRSRLYGLEPIGIGTPECESLISYLIRLARAHCMGPRDLIRLEFMWRYSRQAGIRSSGFFTEYSKTLNSVGDYASGFVRIAEELTGRSDLRFLTMLPWGGVIPEVGTGLLASEPKWCHQCLAEQHDSKQERYSPLAWSLDLYRVCEKHGCRMTDRCPGCGRKQPFIPRLPMQDYCDYCGCWLGLQNNLDETVEVSEREKWLAMAIGDIVRHGAYADAKVTQKLLRSILSGFVVDYAGGDKREMSRMLGLTPTSLACWICKGKKPLLPQFLGICHQFGLLPTKIFMGDQPINTPSAIDNLKLYDIQQGQDIDAQARKKLRMVLVEITNDPADHRSLTEVSFALGVTKNLLIYWFQELCTIITTKHREGMRRFVEQKWQIEAQRVRDVIAGFRSLGVHPSRKRVDAEIYPLSLRRPRLMRVYKETLAMLMGNGKNG